MKKKKKLKFLAPLLNFLMYDPFYIHSSYLIDTLLKIIYTAKLTLKKIKHTILFLLKAISLVENGRLILKE